MEGKLFIVQGSLLLNAALYFRFSFTTSDYGYLANKLKPVTYNLTALFKDVQYVNLHYVLDISPTICVPVHSGNKYDVIISQDDFKSWSSLQVCSYQCTLCDNLEN